MRQIPFFTIFLELTDGFCIGAICSAIISGRDNESRVNVVYKLGSSVCAATALSPVDAEALSGWSPICLCEPPINACTPRPRPRAPFTEIP